MAFGGRTQSFSFDSTVIIGELVLARQKLSGKNDSSLTQRGAEGAVVSC